MLKLRVLFLVCIIVFVLVQILFKISSLTSQSQLPSDYHQQQESRQSKRAALGELVQERLRTLQHPPNCVKAKKLACKVNKFCGFGCTVHHIVYCLMIAYITNRTLILNLIQDYKGASWNQIFLPLSETCMNASGFTNGEWGADNFSLTADVLHVETFESMRMNSPWDALYLSGVPTDIASKLVGISSDPDMWWVGQFAKYIMRPTSETRRMVETAKSMIKMNQTNLLNSSSSSNTTIIISVGIQVRRSDKLVDEADSYSLKEYMKHVEEYLTTREKTEGHPVKGHIYLASDAPEVIDEAMEWEKNTTKWKIYANKSIAMMSTDYQRYESGIYPILIDVLSLADCEFVVCTYSSNICRLVAELKEIQPESEGKVKVVSLDENFHFIPFKRFDSDET